MTSLSRFTMTAAAVAGAVLLAAPARAQKDPKFEYGKVEEVKEVEWKAQAKGGLLLAGGNSQTASGSMAASVSRKAGGNKLAIDGLFAYGTSDVQYADPTVPGSTVIDRISRRSVTTTNMWNAKARYDRFFTANNTGFATGIVGGDYIAGKRLYGGGQLGYSRQLYKSERHLVVAEAGYDFSYESYVEQQGKSLPNVAIHSGRLFVSETAKLLAETGATASVEVLLNLNHENAPNVSKSDGAKGVDALNDTRINAKLGMTTMLWKNLSFGFSFGLRYDQNPAPRPMPAGAPAGATFPPNWMPFAQKVDTLTEATLVVTFL